jgi:3-oxoadipate enol-lactonase
MPSVERLVVDGLGRLPQFAHAGIAGDLVFVAGTLGTGHDLRLVEGGVGPETGQTLVNIERILTAAGLGWDDVAKVNVYLADMADFAAMNEAYDAFFTATPPARITVGGLDLALGARVEMDCVAQRPSVGTGAGAAAAATGANRPIPRREGYVDHDGESIYYQVAGDEWAGDHPPLVLCHGAGGNHASWYQQVSAFARDRMVVTWDHRGFGRSSDRADLSGPEVAVGDLLALVDHLGIVRADLIGQSMGGWTVAGAAMARPGLARSLVLADTIGGFRSDAIDAAMGAPRTVAMASLDGAALGQHPAIDLGFSARHPERAHLYQALSGMGSAQSGVIITRLMALRHEPSAAAAITCPVLCVVGDRDPLFPPASIRATADLFADARVIELPGCGHSPYFEDPEAWNLVVGRFLAGLPS